MKTRTNAVRRRVYRWRAGAALILALFTSAAEANCNVIWQRGARQERLVHEASRIWERSMENLFRSVTESLVDLSRFAEQPATAKRRQGIEKILVSLREFASDIDDVSDEYIDAVEAQQETLDELDTFCEPMVIANQHWFDSKTEVLEELVRSLKKSKRGVRDFGEFAREAESDPGPLMRRLELFEDEMREIRRSVE